MSINIKQPVVLNYGVVPLPKEQAVGISMPTDRKEYFPKVPTFQELLEKRTLEYDALVKSRTPNVLNPREAFRRRANEIGVVTREQSEKVWRSTLPKVRHDDTSEIVNIEGIPIDRFNIKGYVDKTNVVKSSIVKSLNDNNERILEKLNTSLQNVATEKSRGWDSPFIDTTNNSIEIIVNTLNRLDAVKGGRGTGGQLGIKCKNLFLGIYTESQLKDIAASSTLFTVIVNDFMGLWTLPSMRDIKARIDEKGGFDASTPAQFTDVQNELYAERLQLFVIKFSVLFGKQVATRVNEAEQTVTPAANALLPSNSDIEAQMEPQGGPLDEGDDHEPMLTAEDLTRGMTGSAAESKTTPDDDDLSAYLSGTPRINREILAVRNSNLPTSTKTTLINTLGELGEKIINNGGLDEDLLSKLSVIELRLLLILNTLDEITSYPDINPIFRGRSRNDLIREIYQSKLGGILYKGVPRGTAPPSGFGLKPQITPVVPAVVGKKVLRNINLVDMSKKGTGIKPVGEAKPMSIIVKKGIQGAGSDSPLLKKGGSVRYNQFTGLPNVAEIANLQKGADLTRRNFGGGVRRL